MNKIDNQRHCSHERRVVGLHARFCEIQWERSERAKNAGDGYRDLGAVLLDPRLRHLVYAEEEDTVALGAIAVAVVGHGCCCC